MLYEGSQAGITIVGGSTQTITINMTLAVGANGLTLTAPSGAATYYSNTTAPPALEGTCATSTPHTVELNGDLTGPAADCGGTFSFSLAGLSLGTGNPAETYTLTVTQRDKYSEESNALTWTFIFDTVAPADLISGSIMPVTSSSNPLVTGTNTVTITGAAGRCEPGAIVTATQVSPASGPGPQSTTCQSDGSFSLTLLRNTDAAYQFSLNQTDLATNAATTPVAFYWTRDTAIPNPPFALAVNIPAPVVSSFPVPNTEYLTGPASQITATCAVDHRVRLYQDGVELTTAPGEDCTGSSQNISVSGSAVNGTHVYTATQTKTATGVTSAEATATYILDSVAPQSPGIASPVVAAANTTSATYVSFETSITLTGGCESGGQVQLHAGTVASGTTAPTGSPVSCVSGSYSVSYNPGTANDFLVEVSQQDAAQNDSTTLYAKTRITWTSGNSSVPATPTITEYNDNPWTPGAVVYTGTALTSLKITCTTATNTVQVYENGVQLVISGLNDPTCNASPKTINLTGLTATGEGPYTYAVTQENGSFSSGSATLTYVIDATALAPVLTKPTGLTNPSTHTYAYGSGALNSITIEGSCEADANVTISGSASKTVTCGPGGTFSTSVTAFQDGVYIYNVKQVDLALNDSSVLDPPTTKLTWTRTTSTPAAPTITTPPLTVYGDTTYSNQPPTMVAGNCTTDYSVVLSGAHTDAQSCTGGQFNFTLPALATDGTDDGTHTYFVTQADAVGTTSPAAKRIWVYDTLKPAALAITNPTQTPSVTANATQFLLAGTCETEAVVTLGGTVSAGEVAPGNSLTQTCTAGQFSYTISKSAPVPGTDDNYSFNLLQTDRAGNASASITQTWINTASLLVTPSITTPASFPVRTNNGVVGVPSPKVPAPDGEVVIQGSCEYDPAPPENSLNRVFLDDGATDMLDAAVLTGYPYQADCIDAGGGIGGFTINLGNDVVGSRWVWDPVLATGSQTGTWANGTYGFTAFQQKIDNSDSTNPVQTNRSAGVFFQVIVDQTAPAAPALTAPVVLASGGNNSGSPHAGPGPINLAGTCEANADVFYTSSGGGAGSKACASGAFSFTGLNEATDGTYAYTVWQVDKTGNISGNTLLSWLKDSQLVPPPTITVPDTNPFISGVDTLTINGTCAANATVVLAQVSPAAPDQTTGCASGSFSFSVGPKTDAVYDFQLYQDVGGTLSGTIDFQWVLDSTAPIPEPNYALPFDPADPSSVGSPLYNPAHDAVFEFSEQGGDPSATFECNLDGQGFASCTSPLVYTGLATGVTHSLVIRAKDAAGNVTLLADRYERYWVQRPFSTVALYHFDETNTDQDAADDTQYKTDIPPYPQYDGVLTAVGTVGEAGVFGDNARNLNNDAVPADRLHVADQAHLGSLRTKMTVETWAMLNFDNVGSNGFPDSIPGYEMVLASKWDPANARPLWEFGIKGKQNGPNNKMRNLQMYFRTYTQVLDATGAVIISPTPVEAISANLNLVPKPAPSLVSVPFVSAWTHLAMVWNRGVVTFFENGVQSGNARVIGISGLSLLPDAPGELQIGAVQTGAGPTFASFLDGSLDDLRISQDLCYVVGPGAAPTAPLSNADCIADTYQYEP